MAYPEQTARRRPTPPPAIPAPRGVLTDVSVTIRRMPIYPRETGCPMSSSGVAQRPAEHPGPGHGRRREPSGRRGSPAVGAERSAGAWDALRAPRARSGPTAGEGGVELQEVVLAQVDLRGAGVLAHVPGRAGLGDRTDAGMRDDPRERDLRRGRLVARRDAAEHRVRGEPPLFERRVRHERQPRLARPRKQRPLDPAVREVVEDLIGLDSRRRRATAGAPSCRRGRSC